MEESLTYEQAFKEFLEAIELYEVKKDSQNAIALLQNLLSRCNDTENSTAHLAAVVFALALLKKFKGEVVK